MKDKEKEFIERVNCGIAYCEDTPFNETKQDFKKHEERHKQIEEMVKITSMQCGECYTCKFNDMRRFGGCTDYLIANELYEQGYRKIDKDSVVLSRKELKEKYVPRSFYKLAKKVHEEKVKELENLIGHWIENWKQASNETTEKIWNRAYQVALNTRGDITSQTIKELAKRDGVEIKE